MKCLFWSYYFVFMLLMAPFVVTASEASFQAESTPNKMTNLESSNTVFINSEKLLHPENLKLGPADIKTMREFSINDKTEDLSIGSLVQVGLKYSKWNEVMQKGLPVDADFTTNNKEMFLRPMKSELFWLRFSLKNNDFKEISKIIYLPNYISGRIEGLVFSSLNPLGANAVAEQDHFLLQKHFLTGSSVPPAIRDVYEKSPLSGFRLDFQPGEQKYIYLVINQKLTFTNKILISSEKNYMEHSNSEKGFFTFFFGGLFSLIIYNLFVTFYLRDKSYLVYILFCINMTVTVGILAGLLDAFPSIAGSNVSFFVNVQTAFTSFFALQFVNVFLQIKTKSKKLHRFLNVYSMSQLVLTMIIFFGSDSLNMYSGRFIEAVILIGCAACIGIGVWAWTKKEDPLARFYLLSWVVLITCVVWWVASNFGWVEKNFITRFSITIGTLAEMLILSLGLAYRIKMLDQAKAKAEIKAMQKDQYQRLLRIFAHDVSNPLSIINMQSRFLLDPKYFNRHGPEKIAKSIIKAAEHVEKILDYVRKNELEQTKLSQKLDLKKVDMRELLEEAQFIFNNRISDKKIRLEIYKNQNAAILADKDSLLHNVLNNVLSNAIKFTPQGGKIKIEVLNETEFHVLRVVDSGVGMTVEDIDKINAGKDLE